jgi:hypothetical protein
MKSQPIISKKETSAARYTAAGRYRGVVLLVTLVVLLVLATLGYSLASRVAAQRHRNRYLIDYTVACYARDSAVKYALATLQDINDVQLVSRPNEPDFSDLFALSEPDYRKMLAEWAEKLAENQPQVTGDTGEVPVDANEQTGIQLEDLEGLELTPEMKAILGLDESSGLAGKSAAAEANAIDSIKIRGPYGPSWPDITEPVEFEIGSAKVKIEMEDENAKFPAGWGMLSDEKVVRQAQAGLDTFCEWMGLDSDKVASLKDGLKQIAAIKPFKVDFQPTEQKIPSTVMVPSTRRRGVRQQRTVYQSKKVTPAEQFVKQAQDFSKLFHSSLIDTDMLAEPTIATESRKESALKYMDMWGTTQVNINSAPRQVLEAAFTFGGDAQQIADEIIKRRREKPFADVNELKKEYFRFSDSIEKSKPYITAASNVFTIRVTAASGTAKASAVIVVLRDSGKFQRIAFVSG